MKPYVGLCLAFVMIVLVFAGCSKKSSVDTTPIQNSFKDAPAAVQTSADKVVTAVKASDYPTALSELQTLASNAKLTPEQQQAVKDVMAQVQKAVTETADKAKVEATKAVEGVQKSVPK
jgi:hypothetical protein